MATIEAFAPAKINLTLHVTGQRADGYHLLDSLVVFADIGDRISVAPSEGLSLSVDGPMSEGVPTDDSNLAMQAARLLDRDLGAAITLTKVLPPSSGIGGGSSDAAAALRALSELWECPLPEVGETLSLGADLPVCMGARTQRMSGIGEVLEDVSGLPPLDILLVNPGVSVSTPSVFRSLERRDNPAMEAEFPGWEDAKAFCEWLKAQRNDMQAAAGALEPVIGEVLGALQGTGCLHAGMSGSGATCYALFEADGVSAKAARKALKTAHPEWWCASGQVLS
jgi:4-diphosphocytidyl-2-C-methyl-D-erythritol kinase